MTTKDESMTKDEIIDMARQAGFPIFGTKVVANDPMQQMLADAVTQHYHDSAIQFAKLVEAHTRGNIFKPDWDNYRQGLIDGATAEREACAELAKKTVCDTHIPTGVRIYGSEVAKAIRARGETQEVKQHERN